MSRTSYSRRKKNWQWRIIIWSSLFLILGKDLGRFAYHALAIDKAYNTTVTIANKAGLITQNEGLDTFDLQGRSLSMPQLLIDIRNDTPNDYTIETKSTSSRVNHIGHTFSAGETKRFVIRPDINSMDKEIGTGNILFASASLYGTITTICREVHTLKYNLKYANQTKQPIMITLSSITSKIVCQNNSENIP
jgi:hypothetical protein